MKKILNLIIVFAVGFTYGQTITKSSLSAGGGSVSTSSTKVIYTVGENFVQEISSSESHISEGFISPGIMKITGIKDYGVLTGIRIFPNPVDTYLNINFEKEQAYEIYLFDLNGKKILSVTTEITGDQQINLSRQKTGVYVLVIIDREAKNKKILKIEKL